MVCLLASVTTQLNVAVDTLPSPFPPSGLSDLGVEIFEGMLSPRCLISASDLGKSPAAAGDRGTLFSLCSRALTASWTDTLPTCWAGTSTSCGRRGVVNRGVVNLGVVNRVLLGGGVVVKT